MLHVEDNGFRKKGEGGQYVELNPSDIRVRRVAVFSRRQKRLADCPLALGKPGDMTLASPFLSLCTRFADATVRGVALPAPFQ